MAAEQHKYVFIEEGDLVVLSARVIPGNERTVTRVINQLFRLGAEVLYEEIAFVHVSGHACQEDQKLMLNLTKPRFFIPVHGEYRHLIFHARLAEGVGLSKEQILVIEDGMGVELTKTVARVIGRFPVGKVLVDGRGIGDVGGVVLRDRQLLAQDGMVVVALTVDRQSWQLVAGPEIASRGFVYMKESEALIEEAKEVVRQALAERVDGETVNAEILGSKVRTALRRFISQRYDRKPIVLPLVLEV
jgi:ribonuclease J